MQVNIFIIDSFSHNIEMLFTFYSAGSSGHCDISESSSNNSDLSERLSERIANSSAVHPMATSTGSQKSTALLSPALATGSTPSSSVSTTTKPPTSGSSGEACNDVMSNNTSNSTSNTTSSVNHRQVSFYL